MPEKLEIVSDLSGVNSPEPKPEAKPEAKPEPKVSESDTPKPEVKAPEVKPAAKPEPKPEAGIEDLLLAGKKAEVDLDALDMDGLLKHAGLEGKQTEIAKHLMDNGDLPADTYAALKKIGIPKAVAKRLLQAEAEAASRSVVKFKAEAEKVAGGAVELENIRAWFTENTDKAELEQFDSMVRRDPAFYPKLIEIARARYEKDNGPRSSNKPGFAGTPAVAEMPKDIAGQREVLKRAAAGDVAAQKIVSKAYQDHKFKF